MPCMYCTFPIQTQHYNAGNCISISPPSRLLQETDKSLTTCMGATAHSGVVNSEGCNCCSCILLELQRGFVHCNACSNLYNYNWHTLEQKVFSFSNNYMYIGLRSFEGMSIVAAKATYEDVFYVTFPSFYDKGTFEDVRYVPVSSLCDICNKYSIPANPRK